jgi:hypothetical protein
MKIKIELPTNLAGIELRQYQKFLEDIKGIEDNSIIEQKMAQYFCNIKLDDVYSLKISDVNKINDRINTLLDQKTFNLHQTFKLGGVEFGFIPNLEDMTLGEYIDLDNYIGDWSNMHKAMAVLYRPITKKKRAWWSFGKRKEFQYKIEEYKGAITYAEVMKYAPLDVVLGASFFLLSLSKILLNSTQNYLEENNKMMMGLVQKHNLVKSGDGTVQSMHLQKEI